MCINTDKAATAWNKSRLVKTTSYLTSLLVIGNWRWTSHSIMSPLGDCRTTPIPTTCLLDDPFVLTNHGATPQPLSSFVVNLATKSTKAWSLIAILVYYCTSNSLSSIAYRANCPATFGLFIALCKGLSV